MRKFLFVAVAAVLSVLPFAKSEAQNWGIGLRGGFDYGLTVKKYMGGNALDFMGHFHNNGVQVAGLYEWNHQLGSGFTLYYGAGLSLGAWEYGDSNEMGFGLGIDGIVGVEWKIPSVPLALSLDWKPSFEILPETDFYIKGFAFGVKYVF